MNNVVLYTALFDVDNPDGALMTQMTAQVFFVVAEAKDAVLVPVSALRPAAQARRAPAQRRATAGAARARRRRRAAAVDAAHPRWPTAAAVVRVVKPDGTMESRDVRVGVVSRVSAQILSGLEPASSRGRPRTAAPTPDGEAGHRQPADAAAPRVKGGRRHDCARGSRSDRARRRSSS